MSNYACIILELNWNRCFRHYKTNWTFGIIYLCRPDNCKTGNLTSWKERKRLRNVLKWKMHVQSYYFHCKVCKFVTLSREMRSLIDNSWDEWQTWEPFTNIPILARFEERFKTQLPFRIEFKFADTRQDYRNVGSCIVTAFISNRSSVYDWLTT